MNAIENNILQFINLIQHWRILYQLPDQTVCMPFIFLFELIIFFMLLAILIVFPSLAKAISKVVFYILRIISKKPFNCILVIGLVAFTGNAIGNLFVRFPEPAIHDEFSILLAADTFKSGKLANESHAFWEHFQAFHVIQNPTYSSKYLPGQGMLLAMGDLIGGHPVIGLWIGAAFFGISIFWMICGIAPRQWAFFGGIIASLNFCVLGYWGQKYWGGYLSAIACSLVYGALFRLSKKIATSNSLILGAGLAMCLLSRPLESMVALFPGACYFIYLIVKRKNNLGNVFKKVCLPSALILSFCVFWLGYYNLKVTGNVFELPHLFYQQQTDNVPVFLFQKPKPIPETGIAEFINTYKYHKERFLNQQSLSGFVNIKSQEFVICMLFFFRFVFLIPLLKTPIMIKKEGWIRVVVIGCILAWVIAFCEYQSFPRKLSPATGLMVLIIVQGIRMWQYREHHFRSLGKCIILSSILTFLMSVLAAFHPIFHTPRWDSADYRLQIEKKLIKNVKNHLIFVEYEANYVPHFDFVQNHANIDASKMVWARKLDPKKNEKIIEYFPDREVWTLFIGHKSFKMVHIHRYQD